MSSPNPDRSVGAISHTHGRFWWKSPTGRQAHVRCVDYNACEVCRESQYWTSRAVVVELLGHLRPQVGQLPAVLGDHPRVTFEGGLDAHRVQQPGGVLARVARGAERRMQTLFGQVGEAEVDHGPRVVGLGRLVVHGILRSEAVWCLYETPDPGAERSQSETTGPGVAAYAEWSARGKGAECGELGEHPGLGTDTSPD